MRLAGHPAANDAGLGRDELAVFLVAQADGFRRDATASTSRLLSTDRIQQTPTLAR
jgi:hypothetical protein